MIENNPLVSVIMNCYNSDTYLKEAINSVLNQTYQNFEIIFWDNQSTDKSAEIAKSYVDERIKYFYAPTFTPLYEARNYAIEKANGEYITFLDCDDKWYNNKLEKQIGVMHKRKYDFCYSNFYLLNCTNLKKVNKEKQPSGDIFKYQIASYSIGILTVMLRRDKFMKMEEKFDKSFSYPGDFEFFIRFLYETEAIYIDECLCEYRADNPNSISNTKREGNIKELKMAIKKIEELFINEDIQKYINIAYTKIKFQESKILFSQKKYILCFTKIIKIILFDFKSIYYYFNKRK